MGLSFGTDLTGKVAVVTGSARGIGRAIVEKLAAHGAKMVVSCDMGETSYEQKNVIHKILNVTDREAIKTFVDEVEKEYGKIDILVNNAGISARDPLYDYDPAAFEKIMDLNVNAVFNCSQVAACIMKEQGGGVILNTSSMVSIYGQPAGCGYPTSKFAVNGMTKSLARELGKDNIRVNAVAPGVIRTDMVAALPESVIQPLINTIPLRRVGEPEDIANAFVFLASDMASYITGVVLSVDGATTS